MIESSNEQKEEQDYDYNSDKIYHIDEVYLLN